MSRIFKKNFVLKLEFWLGAGFILGFLLTMPQSAQATHIDEFTPPGWGLVSCSGSSSSCGGNTCEGSASVWDLSDRLIMQAWRGNYLAWDDMVEYGYTLNGVLGWSERVTSVGCTCGSGCASEDANRGIRPIWIDNDNSTGVADTFTMFVRGIQLDNRNNNPLGGKVNFQVQRVLCHPNQKTQDGACVNIIGDINVPSASCTSPCDINVTWDTNSYKKVDIYRDGTKLWADVYSPIGFRTDINPPVGNHRYCVRGYGGSDVQTGDLDCGSVQVVNSPLSPGLSITITGTGTGSVISSPSGINCTTSCSATFANNQVVTLTATPFSLIGGAFFAGWSGDPDCTDGSVTMNANKSCIATFDLPAGGVGYTLSVVKAGLSVGTVTSNPAGIDCGWTCPASSVSFANGTSVTLSASTGPGSIFGGWSGGGCSGLGTCTISMTQNRSVTATFSTPGGPGGPGGLTLTIAKTGTGSGTVTSNPAGINCGSTCSAVFTADSVVTLSAVSDPNSSFLRWSGDPDCADGSVTMNANKNCTAVIDLKKGNALYLTPTVNGVAWPSLNTFPVYTDLYYSADAVFYPDASYSAVGTIPLLPAITNTIAGFYHLEYISGLPPVPGAVFKDVTWFAQVTATSPATIFINFTAPTLTVASFSATPSTGNTSVSSILSASVGGTATGTVNYSFWWNCGYAGSDVAGAILACGDPDGTAGNADGNKFDGVSATSQNSVNHTYATDGTYTPLVIVERGVGLFARATTTVTVNAAPPTVSAVTLTEPNYCSFGPGGTISWTYSDPENDPQVTYRAQVLNQGGSIIYDSMPVNSSSTSRAISQGVLQFNTIYYARVMAWEANTNLNSGWVNQTLCDGPGCAANDLTWRTPLHSYPIPKFTWTPAIPPAKSNVNFTDQSTFYDGTSNHTWLWNFGDGQSSAVQNPIHQYPAEGVYSITQTVADRDSYSCFSNQSITVKKPVPVWIEVGPAK